MIQTNLHLPGLLGKAKIPGKCRGAVNRGTIYVNVYTKPLFGGKEIGLVN